MNGSMLFNFWAALVSFSLYFLWAMQATFPMPLPTLVSSLVAAIIGLVVVVQFRGKGRELVVIDHHGKALRTVLTDERLYDGEGLTGSRSTDDPCPAERGTWVLFNVLIIS